VRPAVTSRLLAVAIAAIVVLVQLFALHHEAEVSHVKTALTGDYAHAHALGERHDLSATQHVHSSDPHSHDDSAPCRLLVCLEQATLLPSASAVLVGLAPTTTTVAFVPATAPAFATQLLLIAPKTSPPLHA
jgi:hypothetical protein